MLMILMAIVELGKTKVHRATRWLWLLLSGGLSGAALSCEVTKALPDATADAGEVLDPGTSIDVGTDNPAPADACCDVALYGSPPCKTDADCQKGGLNPTDWYCGPNGFCMPPSADVTPLDATDAADVPEATTDAGADCPPATLYGPPPCTSDADCKEWGDGWYCDLSATVDLGCGKSAHLCVQYQDVVDAAGPDLPGEVEVCQPAGWYGPSPCTSDAQCEQEHGSGWYCDPDFHTPEACEGKLPFPTCVPFPPDGIDAPSADVDCGPINVALYGPQPAGCTSDAECAAQYGEGWTCEATIECAAPPRCVKL